MMIGLIMHYYLGYFLWDKISFINLYYISFYFCMDLWGFIVFMLATKSALLKGAGGLGMVLGSYFMYMEFHDPMNWQERDYTMLVMVGMNCAFIWFITENIKFKKNNEIR